MSLHRVISRDTWQAWILVAVTFERLLAVFVPHRSRILCSKGTATVFIITICVLLSGLNAHFFWINGSLRRRNHLSPLRGYRRSRLWAWARLELRTIRQRIYRSRRVKRRALKVILNMMLIMDSANSYDSFKFEYWEYPKKIV